MKFQIAEGTREQLSCLLIQILIAFLLSGCSGPLWESKPDHYQNELTGRTIKLIFADLDTINKKWKTPFPGESLEQNRSRLRAKPFVFGMASIRLNECQIWVTDAEQYFVGWHEIKHCFGLIRPEE